MEYYTGQQGRMKMTSPPSSNRAAADEADEPRKHELAEELDDLPVPAVTVKEAEDR